MLGSAQPEDRLPSASNEDAPAGDPLQNGRALEGTELDSALQLLVERAQYITGATGTALALPEGEEMVCRASAGASAPAVGARLQVRLGLTGESIARRQLLRCDNAENDPRVNLETCRALGIASIVVLPLLRRNGEIRGLFELFSDHPYAFEERDLVALERMADLTSTALDLAEQRLVSEAAPTMRPDDAMSAAAIPSIPRSPGLAEPSVMPAASATSVSSFGAAAAPVRAPLFAVDVVQKCSACGFPVSEGRTLCLDCEKLESEKFDAEKKDGGKKDFNGQFHEPEPVQIEQHQVEQNLACQDQVERPQVEQHKVEPQEIKPDEPEQVVPNAAAASAALEQEEFVPAFLANPSPAQKSWLANPVNLLAIAVLILGVLVAVVVFR